MTNAEIQEIYKATDDITNKLLMNIDSLLGELEELQTGNQKREVRKGNCISRFISKMGR